MDGGDRSAAPRALRRTVLGTIGALVAVLLLVIAGSEPASARRIYPSAQQVRDAKRRAAAAAAEVQTVQARLAASADAVQQADEDLSVAAENFDQAQVELAAAQQAATAAQATARAARVRLATAQRQVGQLAVQAYQGGGGLASLGWLFAPDGPQDAMDRASSLHALGLHRQRQVHELDEARVTATIADQQAAAAVAAQQKATDALAAARVQAEQRAATAHAVLAQQTAAQHALVIRLAQLQRISVQMAQARAAGLAAAAQARREAAERAARQRQAGSGSDGSSDVPIGSSSGSAAGGREAVAWAKQKIGLPYQWGGDGPGSYDCSGLTMKAWAHVGVGLPHSSVWQYRSVTKVPWGDLRPGDLIFYARNPDNPATIHHVTLYAGGGMMIEAPFTGADVREVPVRRGYQAMPYVGRP